MRPVLSALLAVTALAVLPTLGSARAFTVEDLLRQESFGNQAIDPSGRWLVIERRDCYDTAPRFDHDLQTSAALSRLLVVDLARPAAARPLLATDPGPGLQIGAFSPSGHRLAVYRLDGQSWTLGVVTLATGQVRWFPAITPEKAVYGRTLHWLSDRDLLVIHRPDRAQPWAMRIGKVSAQRLPALWAASARGEGARTVFGSGAYAGLRPRAQPRELLRLDAEGAAAPQRLATGALFDLEVSPDRRRVALLEAGDSVQAQRDGPVQGEMGIATEAARLSVLDLDTGQRRTPRPHGDTLPLLLSWSPDSRSLLTFMRAPGAPWTAGGLLRIDAASGIARRIADGLTPKFLFRPETVYAGWMGRDPIVLARPTADPTARLDWYRLAEDGAVNLTRRLPVAPQTVRAHDASSLTFLVGDRLWRVDTQGATTEVTARAAGALREPRSARDARLENALPSDSWMLTGEAGSRRLQWLDARGLRGAISVPATDDQILMADARARFALLKRRDDRGREALHLVGASGLDLVVASVNAGWADLDPPRVRRVRHTGPEGQPLVSWLFLPPARPGPPPALIVRPYLGASYAAEPRDLPAERGFVTDVRALVGHGYAVLVPSLPLPATRADLMPGLADRLLGIVRAAATDPVLTGAFDPERLGLWGHSFGGYSVMATITQTDRFRAAVSISGVSNLVSKWETLASVYRVSPEEGAMFNWSMGSVESGQSQMGGPPWADLDRYRRNSPLFAADRIRTPLLLMHGDQDLIVINQSEAMFAALYRQSRDAQMVVYWGEGHGIASPGNVRDLYARAFAFLDERLGPIDADGGPPSSPAVAPANGAPTPPPPPG